MKLIEKKGTTSKIIHLFILDSSKSDGSGLTGLLYTAANLTAYYIREGAASTTLISLVNATIGTYTSGGFKEVDATNTPGIYELHLPNTCLAAGTDQVVIFLKGADDMVPVPIEIQLVDNIEKDTYDRAGTILDDTHELQGNQGNWLTAAGFSVPNEYDTVIATLALEATLTAMKGTGFAGTTDSLEAIRNRGDAEWVTASGFATLNPPSQVLADYKATGFNTTTPPTVGEIRTEMEGAGTKLSEVLTDTGTTLDDKMDTILGMSQENLFIDNTVFTGANMTGARIRIYSVAGSVGTASDVIATYTVTVTYAGDNMTDYKVVKS